MGNISSKILYQLNEGFIDAKLYSASQGDRLSFNENVSNTLEIIREVPNIKNIGYIVTTCSPVTNAHIELATHASNKLDLDALIFILWPFEYIEGFHSENMLEWVANEKHPPWETRVSILAAALDEIADSRFFILDMAKEWYIESKRMFNPLDSRSYYWTGSWYIIRRLQQQLGELSYFFVCGADQFNPNIDSLTSVGGVEKVWKDYSISQQLAIHNVFAVPRSEDGRDIQYFSSPSFYKNQVIISDPLLHCTLSATCIRTKEIDSEELERFCPSGAVSYIRDNQIWGYTN